MFPPGRDRDLPLVEVEASQIGEQGDAIPRILDGSLAGVIVRGVVAPDLLAALVARLEEDGDALPRFCPPVFKGKVFGKPLVSAASGLGEYLESAARFRAGCTALFASYPDIEQSVDATLKGLARDLAVSVPRTADDRPYLPVTIRMLVEGDRLPLHYENETLQSPVMDELRPRLDVSTLMSFYMPLAVPAEGGLLRLFWTHCLQGGDSLIERLGGEERARPHFEERGFNWVLPKVGDLLVFDGGRWYHDVTPIVGGKRWTWGGFLAATRDGRAVHYWS